MALYIIIQMICVLWKKKSIHTGKKKEKISDQKAYCLEIIMVKILGYFHLDYSGG